MKQVALCRNGRTSLTYHVLEPPTETGDPLQERWNAELGALETRGSSLRFCNYHYPSGKSFPGVRIVCIAGEVMTALSPIAVDYDNYRLDFGF